MFMKETVEPTPFVLGDIMDVIYPCAQLGGVTTLSACEHFCGRYSRCDNVALANDKLVEAEDNNASHTKNIKTEG